MKRRILWLLSILLVLGAGVWALLPLFAPYDPDNSSPVRIIKATLTRDHGNYWLVLSLEGDLPSEPDKNYGLYTPLGDRIKSAATVGNSPIPNKFWLEEFELDDTLTLELDGHVLDVKATKANPDLPNGTTHRYRNKHWTK